MADAMRIQQPPRHAPWWVIACVLAALLVVGELGYMKHTYGEFRFWPTAVTPKLHFDGRDYRESSVPPVAEVGWFGGWGLLGHTPGGGEIWGDPNASYAPTVLWVHDGDRYHQYSLLGGP